MGQQDKYLPKYVRSEFEAYLKCGRLEYGFLRVRCDDCHHEHQVAFSWPLLRIHVPAAFVYPARHHAEAFSRGLPDRAVVRGEWQKAPPCWLMMYCPMSPLSNGYCVSQTCHTYH
jgi:ribosomal protein S27E